MMVCTRWPPRTCSTSLGTPIRGRKQTEPFARGRGLSRLNGICADHSSDALYELTMRVAERRIHKPAVVAGLERIATYSVEETPG
jgi:hypothetical protein